MGHEKMLETLLVGMPTEAMRKFEEGPIALVEAMKHGGPALLAIAAALQLATKILKEERTTDEISWEFETDDGQVTTQSVRFSDEEARAEATRLMVRAAQRYGAAAFGGKGGSHG